MDLIKLSPTSVEQFERESDCTEFWRGNRLDKEFRIDPTQPMLMGLAFEQLVEGADGAEETLAMVKSKTDKSRVQQQADLCKRYFDPKDELFMGWNIKRWQVPLGNEESRGIADIEAEDGDEIAIIDLKFTANLLGKYGFKNWLNLQSDDILQLAMYKQWYRQEYGIDPSMFYMVFDHTPQMNKRIIEVDISSRTERRGVERFDDVRKKVADYRVNGFPVKPSPSNCKDCPLDCEYKHDPNALFYEKVCL